VGTPTRTSTWPTAINWFNSSSGMMLLWGTGVGCVYNRRSLNQ
jgi:hypothetical protein